MKRAFRRIEERLPSHQGNALFVCKQCYLLPSPVGEGLGVRLLLSLGGGWEGFPDGASVPTLKYLPCTQTAVLLLYFFIFLLLQKAHLLVNLSTRQLEPTLSLCFSNA